MPLRRVMARLGSITCSASRHGPSLTDPEGAPSFFRTAIKDDTQAAFRIADRMMAPPKASRRGASWWWAATGSGAELAGTLAAELTARGAETVVISYPSATASSCRPRAPRWRHGDVVVAITAADPLVLAAMPSTQMPADDGQSTACVIA